MPTEGGGMPAIAVEKRTGDNLISLYSVIITLIFIPAWKLIAFTAGRYLHDDVEVVRKQGSPWTSGFRQLLGAFSMPWEEVKATDKESSDEDEPDTNATRQGTLFVFSILFFLGSLVAGIFVPPLLVIGAVAPVQPAAVFFPHILPGAGDNEGWKYQALKAPAATRAVGGVGAAMTQGGVTFDGGSEDYSVHYSYQVTGVDFGLQEHWGRLVQGVDGRCVLVHDWVDDATSRGLEENSTDVIQYEYYRPWDSQRVAVPVSRNQTFDPPWVTMHLHENIEQTTNTTGNNSFAMIPHSVGRLSFTSSIDPWYETDPITGELAADVPGAHQVLPTRPALSCWQKDTWSFDGNTVSSVFRLSDLPGLDLPLEWDNFLRIQLSAPRIFDVGVSLGRSSLVSSTTFLDRVTIGTFDAGSSSLSSDVERLVWAAYVSSRDVFRESTMVLERHYVQNDVEAFGRDETPDFAKFVLATPAVATLSLRVLISLPVVCVSLWIVHLTITHLYNK